MISQEEYSRICELIAIERSRHDIKYPLVDGELIIRPLEYFLNAASAEMKNDCLKSLQIIPVYCTNFKKNFDIEIKHKMLKLQNFVFHCVYDGFDNPNIDCVLVAFWLNPL